MAKSRKILTKSEGVLAHGVETQRDFVIAKAGGGGGIYCLLLLWHNSSPKVRA